MSEHPWFKFYPADWRSESALRMVSMGARALWVEMLCLMHESEPRGYLVVRDKPLAIDRLAILAGCPLSEAVTLLSELEGAGVCSRTPGGVLFSRKMVRESRISEEQRQRAESRWSATRAEKVEQSKFGNAETDTGLMPISKIPEPELEPERISDANASSVISALPKPTGPEPDEIKSAFDEWNLIAQRLGLPTARKLDAARRKAIRCRLVDGGLDAWREALSAVELSRYCRGDNDRGWRADLDFVCQPKSWRRLLEGSYGAGAGEGATIVAFRGTGPPAITERLAQESAEARRRALEMIGALNGKA
jgi:hypothetical protein